MARATTRWRLLVPGSGGCPLSTVMRAGETDEGPDRLALAREARAFNLGLQAAGWREFTHIGKLDGDVELPPQWFATLLGLLPKPSPTWDSWAGA